MARLSIKIALSDGGRLGPGKIALLEAVEQEGSISAAGRKLGMSYRRAWDLIQDLNQVFGQPMLDVTIGGKSGGGAILAPGGRKLVDLYRNIERTTYDLCADGLKDIESLADRK